MPGDAIDPPLSERMEKVLAPDGPPFGLPRATREELSAIRALLRGGERRSGRYAIGRAMRVVAHGDPSDATAKLLGDVAADRELDPAVRRQAAALLGDILGEASTAALLPLLGRGGRAMESVVLRSLAKVGGDDAARAIAALPETDSPALARMRAAARAAILYRGGEAIDEPTEKKVMPRGAPLPIHRQSREVIARIAAAVTGSAYGIAINREIGFTFRCGGPEHALLLDEGLRRGSLVRDLTARPRLAGIIAMDDRSTGRFVPRRIVLTRPDGEIVRVSVLRPSGEVALFGTLEPAEGGLALKLRDHGGERVPTQVEGLVTDGDIALRGRIFAETAAPKQRPAPIRRR